MSDYVVTVEYTGDSLCPWHYYVQAPDGRVIDESHVYDEDYAEKRALHAIANDKHRIKTRRQFTVSANTEAT